MIEKKALMVELEALLTLYCHELVISTQAIELLNRAHKVELDAFFAKYGIAVEDQALLIEEILANR